MARIVARVANCQGVSERRPQDEARAALTREGKYGLPDIVLLSEIAWLNLPALCDELGWHGIQHGTQGSPEGGVGIACSVPIEPLGLLVGSKATSEGTGGVRMRPVVGGEAWGIPWWALHAPPPDSPKARRAYIGAARCCSGTLGGDWNQPVANMRRTSERAYRGSGVLGILTPHALNPGKAATVNIGSDHPAVDVVLHHVPSP